LCDGCEQTISGYEKPFAENVFVPLHLLHRNEASPFRYDDWGLKFCVSVLWRLVAEIGDGGLSHLTEQQRDAARTAERTWREFLVGSRSTPGQFEVHVLPLDEIESHTYPELSPFINRYFLRAVDSGVVANSSMAFVFAKLCRVLVIGFVQSKSLHKWQGTRLRVRRGTIGGPVKYVIEKNVFNYFNNRATQAASVLAGLSARQKSKVEIAVRENLDTIAASEILRGMTADIRLAGQSAFRVTEGTAPVRDHAQRARAALRRARRAGEP
jgi:hypothetical protein